MAISCIACVPAPYYCPLPASWPSVAPRACRAKRHRLQAAEGNIDNRYLGALLAFCLCVVAGFGPSAGGSANASRDGNNLPMLGDSARVAPTGAAPTKNSLLLTPHPLTQKSHLVEIRLTSPKSLPLSGPMPGNIDVSAGRLELIWADVGQHRPELA